MFTGLIETTGVISARKMNGDAGKLEVVPAHPLLSPTFGESIAVNGVCLTLEQGMNGGNLVFHVMRESFSRTNLGILPVGSKVNLERALPANGRLGGHIVSGHVDGVGEILEIVRRASDTEMTVRFPEELTPYLVEKGSVAIDGISLTVEKVGNGTFRVGIIPTTWKETNLSGKHPGDPVNLETDVLGKYVISYLERTQKSGRGVSMTDLAEAGFL